MPARNTTRVNINNGRCALQNSEHPNWATNWCLCQMLRARPPTRRPSPETVLVGSRVPRPDDEKVPAPLYARLLDSLAYAA